MRFSLILALATLCLAGLAWTNPSVDRHVCTSADRMVARPEAKLVKDVPPKVQLANTAHAKLSMVPRTPLKRNGRVRGALTGRPSGSLTWAFDKMHDLSKAGRARGPDGMACPWSTSSSQQVRLQI